MKRHVTMRLSTHGGHGAFREFVETILRREDVMDRVIALCIAPSDS